jgi:ATP-dependent Lon protease
LAKSPPSPATPEHALPLLPTRELIVFPKMVAPIFVGREKSVRAIERAFAEGSPIVLSSQREPTIEDPTQDDILPVYRGDDRAVFQRPDGSGSALSRARSVCISTPFAATTPHFVVNVTVAPADRNARRSQALARRVLTEFGFYVSGTADP